MWLNKYIVGGNDHIKVAGEIPSSSKDFKQSNENFDQSNIQTSVDTHMMYNLPANMVAMTPDTLRSRDAFQPPSVLMMGTKLASGLKVLSCSHTNAQHANAAIISKYAYGKTMME